MKTIILSIFSIAFLLNCLDASCTGAPSGASTWLSDTEISVRGAAFMPWSHKVRKIYSKALPDVQLEVEKYFCDPWSVWLGAQYIENSGNSIGLHNKTRLQLVPVSFGVKYNFYINPCIHVYAGAGPVYSYLRIKDHSEYVQQHISKETWGGQLKTGVKYYFTESFFIEAFADYLFQRFSFKNKHETEHYVTRHDANLDAVIAGGGIGFRF